MSSADKTNTIINCVSSAIVNVKQQCLSSAAAAFVLKIQNADKVVIHGLTSDNEATESTNCSQTNDIEVKSIYGNLTDMLNTVIQALPNQANVKKTFIATLTSAINVQVVTTCFSNALAAVKIDISNVPAGGTVTFDNVKVQNKATAAISSCIQTVAVHVGGKNLSMKEYIDANVGWMTAVGGTNATKTDNVATVKIPPPPVASVFKCETASSKYYDTDLLVIWILTIVLGLVTVGRVVYCKYL